LTVFGDQLHVHFRSSYETMRLSLVLFSSDNELSVLHRWKPVLPTSPWKRDGDPGYISSSPVTANRLRRRRCVQQQQQQHLLRLEVAQLRWRVVHSCKRHHHTHTYVLLTLRRLCFQLLVVQAGTQRREAVGYKCTCSAVSGRRQPQSANSCDIAATLAQTCKIFTSIELGSVYVYLLLHVVDRLGCLFASCLLRHVRRDWALLSFHSVCLSGCLSVIPRPTAYHDWSITSCPRIRLSLFGSPISHTVGARGKNMQNFAYAYSCHCERDAPCHMTCMSVIHFISIPIVIVTVWYIVEVHL